MSRVAYYLDFVVVPALILVLTIAADVRLGAVLLGLAGWTLAEYLIHRVLFHRLPLFKPAHDLHHARPSGRTGVSSWCTLAIIITVSLVVPPGPLVGLLLGYLGYITAHHAVHHWRVGPGHPLYGLKMRHRMHHSGIEANFGVVTTLWDRVFRTHQAHR